MACEKYETRIDRYVDGVPDGGLEEHLRICSDCRDVVDALLALDQSLALNLRPPPAPARFRSRVLRRVAELDRTKPVFLLSELLDLLGVAGVAAAAVWFAVKITLTASAGFLSPGALEVLPWAVSAVCVSAGLLSALVCLFQPLPPIK